MKKMEVIARIAFAVLGLYIILTYFKNILSALYIIRRTGDFPISSILMTFLSLVITIVVMIIVAHQLIYRGEKWAQKIATYTQESKLDENNNWLGATYRIISVILGILFLYWTTFTFFVLLNSLLRCLYSEHEAMYSYYKPSAIANSIEFLVQLGLSVYLLCGAPHFVRWQIKKTLEFCKEFGETEYSESGQETDILGG